MIERIQREIDRLDRNEAYVISDQYHCGSTFVWMEDLEAWVAADVESGSCTMHACDLKAVKIGFRNDDDDELDLTGALGQDVEAMIKVVEVDEDAQ